MKRIRNIIISTRHQMAKQCTHSMFLLVDTEFSISTPGLTDKKY